MAADSRDPKYVIQLSSEECAMTTINRRSLLLLATSTLLLPLRAVAQPMRVTLYKDPQCPCCEGHADYLNKNGFSVEIIPTPDLLAAFREAQVPPELNGCHLIKMDGYVVIGHVPMDPIRKLLSRPILRSSPGWSCTVPTSS